MTADPKKLLDIHISEWESTGSECPEGSRDWLVNQEPPPNWFDYFWYYVRHDFEAFVDAVETYLLPQRFWPEHIDLNGDDAAEWDTIENATGGVFSVLSFTAGEYKECQVRARVRCNNSVSTPTATKVVIEWSSAGASAKACVWQVKYLAVGNCETYRGTPSTIEEVSTDVSVVHGRVQTTVDLPVLTQGKTLMLQIAHDGTSGSDEMVASPCVHSISVA